MDGLAEMLASKAGILCVLDEQLVGTDGQGAALRIHRARVAAPGGDGL